MYTVDAMAGTLTHSPADVLRWALVALGVAADPEADAAWPAYVSREPSLPDDCLTVQGAEGVLDGFNMPAKDVSEHHGCQVRVRARLYEQGRAKARAVCLALDGMHRLAVSVTAGGAATYRVTGRRTGDVIEGRPETFSDRETFFINALLDVTQTG